VLAFLEYSAAHILSGFSVLVGMLITPYWRNISVHKYEEGEPTPKKS
jgi:hypothetical protein